MRSGAALAGLVLAGCPSPSGFEIGDEVVCGTPVEGWARLEEQAEARGLAAGEPHDHRAGNGCLFAPGGVLAHDLDGDGDVDLAFTRVGGLPTLYANDGSGGFEPVAWPAEAVEGVAALDRPILAASAVDLDGDGLSEIALSGQGVAMLLHNEGGLAFAAPEALLLEEGYPRTCYHTMAWGDADGDGDLDLVLPGLDPVDAPDGPPPGMPDRGTPDQLLRNDGGRFELLAPPVPEDPQWLSLLGHFTDRDGDGDLDLLVTTDRPGFSGGRAAFYRNDGPGPDGTPTLVDDASAIGARIAASAMGLAARDFDGDGLLDYCVTDTRPWIECLVSSGGEGYIRTGIAQGLVVEGAEASPEGASSFWTGWGLDLLDLDNDGHTDAAAAAGRTPGPPDSTGHEVPPPEPDTLWRGQADGSFIAATSDGGWDEPDHHYGLVGADLSGDGALELVVGVQDGVPLLWDNPCTAGAWIAVELIGPAGNREGYGAQVVVEAGGRSERQEMQALRAMSQGPSRLHFGLGAATTVDRIEVVWPGGERVEAEGLDVNRVITVSHPEE